MTPKTTETIIAALDSLLERERRAILAGALDELAPLMGEKSALIDALTNVGPPRVAMDGVRAKARRNQDLIESAMDGIRSVAQRLATIRRLRASMDTYDSAGQRHPTQGGRGGSVEKRA